MQIRPYFSTALCSLLLACDLTPATLAPVYAQPKTAPARNFTSFDGALRCMDRVLAAKKRKTTFISSTGIPDETRSINVAGDDMLINALNRMNRRSQAYIFLDQGLVRADGLIDLLVVQREDPPRPNFYIRGAISQLDRDVGTTDIDIDVDDDILDDEDFLQVDTRNDTDLSVVSVDLHLVRYPSRQIVPGASVSNSMVVRERRFGLDSFGLIDVTGLEFDLQINRIESNGQAVRNLIEVSAIELIGRHSGVPFWHCLSEENTDAQKNSFAEQQFHSQGSPNLVLEAQKTLAMMNKYSGKATGKLDRPTRPAIAAFQAEENLLVNGTVDFDTFERLRTRASEHENRFGKSEKSDGVERQVLNETAPKASAPNSTGASTGSGKRVFLPPDQKRSKRTERNDAGFIPLEQFLEQSN